MYLKKIEIQGFKSFADKTEIEFKDDITAIVGPNGSGKSNISDAIRWVLGEQSIKNLRGTKMEDVIFSGTDKRRPLGYAEVSITFDNKDSLIPLEYGEVMVTRRVFRSGESEYYLNKNSCRLKDIRELFMDTGVGKDGYSIIGQGRIEEILSNRPEDRRSIFEEAAEIVKYKTKKESAERKLEKTEHNLVRIKDLIHEITKQSKTLEEESEKAINFTSIYNKLRDLEVNLFIKDIKKLNSQIEEINIDRGKIISEINEIEIEKKTIEEKFNLLKTDIESMDHKIEDTRNQRFTLIQSLDNNKNQINLHLEKENFYKRDLNRLEKEKKELEDSLNNLLNTNVDMENERSSIIDKLEELYFEYEEKNKIFLNSESQITQKEMYIEKVKSDLITIYNKVSDKRSELNSIDSFNENIEKRIEWLDKEKEKNISMKKISNDNIKSSKIKEESLKKNLKNLSLKLNESIKKRDEIQSKYDGICDSIKDKEIELQGILSSQKLYKSMEEEYEGYFKSVKNLLQGVKKSKDMGQGFLGVVADLIKVEERLERAIDISLGSNIQNFVMETDRDAKRMIDYLKANRLGRVTFLPLNTIKGNTISLKSDDIKEFKILGLGHNLIQYKEKYNEIFKYLLGRTIIIEDMDNGLNFAKKYGHIYRIVTLDGDILNPGGSMTGGSYGNNNISIINRKNRIAKLDRDIDELKLSLEKYNSLKLEYLEDLKYTNETIQNIESRIKEEELQYINITNDINTFENEINRLEQDFERLIGEEYSLNKETEGFSHKKNSLNLELVDLDKSTNDIKSNIKELTEDLIKARSIKDNLNNEVTDLKIKINMMENTLKNLEDKSEGKIKDRELTNKLILEKENTISLNNRELTSIKDEESKLIQSIKVQEEEEKIITEKFNGLILKKEEFMKTFYREQDRLKDINDRLGIMEKQKNSQEIKLARYELQLESTHTKLLDEYELTFDSALSFETEISNIQKTIDEVKKFKTAIKDLGSVNIGSIEEYKIIKERLEFITTQHDDLTASKENLRDVIKDMEKKMRVQFTKSFNEINENFNEIFSKLFSGGKANLELEDGEDVLKSGIEIKVQPPGKRLQSLSLLSGGEKSLTAVALLFAILKTKPAPFCILDEIDAALDEANIGRYTNYLKNFNEDTQFIMITHRKTTMEIADVLYGVTMAEEGVSKLISVKLKDNLDGLAS